MRRPTRRWGTRRGAVGSVVATVIAVGVVAVPACSSEPGAVRVEDAMIGETSGKAAALYLTLRNDGGDDALVGANCDCAQEASVHVTDTDGGRSAMRSVERLDVPSGETVRLSPGGSHVMLEHLDGPLAAGTSVELSLEFDSGTQTVIAEVVPLAELNELAGAGS